MTGIITGTILMRMLAIQARPGTVPPGGHGAADSVPDPSNPQAFNRYLYVLGNPLKYTDPTGHLSDDQILQILGEQGHLLDYWKNYDPYFYQVLLALGDGDTLTASGVSGALQCWIDDGGIANLKSFGNATTNLWDWQGGGGYILQAPGAPEKEAGIAVGIFLIRLQLEVA